MKMALWLSPPICRMIPHMYHNCEFFRFSNSLNQDGDSEETYAVVLLNYQMPLATLFLWKKACFKICADGGANQLYDSLPTFLSHENPYEVRKRFKPDVIKGDLDSIRPEVKEFYGKLGTIILDASEDQDTTDLHKCILHIKDMTRGFLRTFEKILVLGALGGRLDHEFAHFNVLYKFPSFRIILLSDESMTYLLPSGCVHEIHINPDVEGPHCGLVPLGKPSASTTTTGLRWNLESTPMEFGSLISTSNEYESNIVTVSSDSHLLWTITIQRLRQRLSDSLQNI